MVTNVTLFVAYVLVNVKFIFKTVIFSLSIFLLLPSTSFSLYQNPINLINIATFLSESFEIGPEASSIKNIYGYRVSKRSHWSQKF